MPACAANCAAVSADTSSAAAGTNAVIGPAAALSALIAEPISDKSLAAAASMSGSIVVNDMCLPPSELLPMPMDGVRCQERAIWIATSDSQWGDVDARSSFLSLFDKAFEQFSRPDHAGYPVFWASRRWPWLEAVQGQSSSDRDETQSRPYEFTEVHRGRAGIDRLRVVPRENGLPRIAQRKSLYGLDGVDGQDVIHGIVASETDRDESAASRVGQQSLAVVTGTTT